jgi:hypothetical protein
MTISVGATLGAYAITALLGEGGTLTEELASPPIAVILNWRPSVRK